jgi:SynChlorMet cassette radical SAM/SPASM protein ScmF
MDKTQKKNQSPAENGTPALSQLYFYLTEGCNLACRHCWLAPKFDPAGDRYPVLPLELFSEAIRDSISLGLSGVKLTGGEPLLHPDIMEILEIIRQHGLDFTMETNGLLCTTDIAAAIALQENPFVSISLDGADEKTHDKIRGLEGAFVKATSAVRQLAVAGVKPQIIMSIMRSNVDQIEGVIKLAEDLGAGSVKFNIVQPTGRGQTISNGAAGIKIDKLIKLGRQVEGEMSDKTGLKLYYDYPAAFHSLRYYSAAEDNCRACSILSILGVLPNGAYALCGIGSHVKDLVFGKIGHDSLAEIWGKNPVLHQLRNGLPHRLTGICSHCLMKHQCLGSCIAQNYYSSGSLWAPYWFCEQADAMGLFPASRLNYTLNEPEAVL